MLAFYEHIKTDYCISPNVPTLEQATRIELASQPWQGYIITIILRLHVFIYYQIYINNSRKKCFFGLIMIQLLIVERAVYEA